MAYRNIDKKIRETHILYINEKEKTFYICLTRMLLSNFMEGENEYGYFLEKGYKHTHELQNIYENNRKKYVQK